MRITVALADSIAGVRQTEKALLEKEADVV